MPKLFSDPEAIAEDIIRDVGTNLVVGLPLGLGKANHVVNALYARAAADRAADAWQRGRDRVAERAR